MLFVIFQLGDDRYALDAAGVEEVLPWVRLKQIPRAPAGVAGVFSYRGEPVPVIDLCATALGRPAATRLSTRLLVVRLGAATGGRRIALLAERATETLRREPADFAPAGVTAPEARYLGPVAPDPRGGLIQRIEVDQLLPPPVREALFHEVALVP
jgi:chemotaxis-related protein WspB